MLEQRINDILTSWNPLDVPDGLACHEYEFCIGSIIPLGDDVEAITEFLRKMVSETMGLNYDHGNSSHRDDLESVAKEIAQVIKEYAIH